MISLASALAVFLATHLLPGIKTLRQACIAGVGERLYFGLYSIASIGAIGWVIWAYGDAPYIELWPPSLAAVWVVVLVMPVACFLIVSGLSSANPFSLGLGANRFDATRPGIVGLCKHPVFWGLLIWAAAHVGVNGDGASLMLFGCLGLLSAAGPRLLDKKRQTTLGRSPWQSLTNQVKQPSFWRIIGQIGPLRMAAAALLYVGLLFAHGLVLGVSPLAGLDL